MDKITQAQMNEFCKEHDLEGLEESIKFEHYVGYATVQSLYGESFDTEDIVLGGHEPGIDAIAVVVNGALVTDIDAYKAISESASTLDVDFIFVQADRSTSFDSGKLGTFGFAVLDFFADSPSLKMSPRLRELAQLQAAIYRDSNKFKRANPSCHLFYATTGQWQNDSTLEARRASAIADIKAKNIFSKVQFNCIGADQLQKLYRQAKSAIAREFTFENHVVAPEIPGVKEAYLGFIPAKNYIPLITGDDGDILRGIFESNLRDFQGLDNPINNEIGKTLKSNHKARFVLMNNGITVIARILRRTSNRFYIEDFQIVNGCQTSNVLFQSQDALNDVMIPLRLISSDDDEVIQSIVTATNQQTQLSREQLFAATEFPKKLEQFFLAQDTTHRLYYERRARQYDKLAIEKIRIVTQANTIRAFAGMFLEEPHRTTRNFSALLDNIGKTIFVDGHKLDPYYVAALTLFRLERLFRNQSIDRSFKAARFQILLAARRIAIADALPKMNSHEMEKYCRKLLHILWDPAEGDALIIKAAAVVATIAENNLDRDNIRTATITDGIKNYSYKKIQNGGGV